MIEIWKLYLIVGMVLTMAIFGALFYRWQLKKRVNRIMEEVDETIAELICHRRKNSFSQMEDSLLGKFQHEILQLYDMLCSYEEREKVLRSELNSSISDLVHQINTPITNIKMYGGFLVETDLEETQRRKFAENIVQQAEKLSWLLEGFGKLSRLETGIMVLQPEISPILPPLLRAIDQISLKATQHGNEICLKGNQKLCAYLDEKWTEEVFYNLLDNAVKYGERDSCIIVELMEYELYVRVDVKNQGEPLSREETVKVFQRFYRGKQWKEQMGVGLGLYLSQKIIREQCGYIKVGSPKENQTIFSVFLSRQ